MSEAEIAACAVEQTVSATQQRLVNLAADIGLTSATFRRVRDDYYELRDLNKRRRAGTTSLSAPLTGTFGATPGAVVKYEK